MKLMKKLFALALCLALLLSLAACGGKANSSSGSKANTKTSSSSTRKPKPPKKPSKGLEYSSDHIIDGNLAVIGIGECTDTHIVVPAEHDGIPVVAVWAGAFQDNDQIVSVYLPDSVTSVGDGAFRNCTALQEVVLPSGLIVIEPTTFLGCTALQSIELPDGISRIGNFSFQDSGLRSIELPSKLDHIGKSAFSGVPLTSITFPEGLLDIDDGAFENDTGLTSVVIPGTVWSIGSNAFRGCSALKTVEIQEGEDDARALLAGQYFDGCAIETITLPACTWRCTYSSLGCSEQLKDIYFGGTMERWESIAQEGWDSVPVDYTVHCADGDLSKTGSAPN